MTKSSCGVACLLTVAAAIVVLPQVASGETKTTCLLPRLENPRAEGAHAYAVVVYDRWGRQIATQSFPAGTGDWLMAAPDCRTGSGRGVRKTRGGNDGDSVRASQAAAVIPSGVVKRGAPQISGRFPSSKAVGRVIRRGMAAIRSCYQRGLLRNSKLQGHLSVRLVIGRGGRVKRAEARSARVADPAVKRCITSYAKRWRFPAPEGSAEITVPLHFEPAR